MKSFCFHVMARKSKQVYALNKISLNTVEMEKLSFYCLNHLNGLWSVNSMKEFEVINIQSQRTR